MRAWLLYYTMIGLIWCTEQSVFLRVKIFDSTVLVLNPLFLKLKHLTRCGADDSGPTCLLKGYLFEFVQFQMFTYTKSVHTFK